MNTATTSSQAVQTALAHLLNTITNPALMHSSHWAKLDMLKIALRGDTFSPKDLHTTLDAIRQDIIELVANCYTTIDDRDVSPESRPALAIAQEYANEACARHPLFTQNRDEATSRFFSQFPSVAQRIADNATSGAMHLGNSAIDTLAPWLEKRRYHGVKPYNMAALLRIMDKVPDMPDEDFIRMANDFQNRNIDDGELTAMARLASKTPPGCHAHMLKNFRMIFHTRQPNILLAAFVLGLKCPPPGMLAKAVRTLYMASTNCHIELQQPFTIPHDESGESLCRTIDYIQKCHNVEDNLMGLPTEDELRARTIEVQMTNKHLFQATLEARDRLQTRLTIGTDSIVRLRGMLEALCKRWKRPEIDFLQHLDDMRGTPPDAETRGTIIRLLSIASTTDGHWINSSNTILWGESITEKKARHIADALQQLIQPSPQEDNDHETKGKGQ